MNIPFKDKLNATQITSIEHLFDKYNQYNCETINGSIAVLGYKGCLSGYMQALADLNIITFEEAINFINLMK